MHNEWTSNFRFKQLSNNYNSMGEGWCSYSCLGPDKVLIKRDPQSIIIQLDRSMAWIWIILTHYLPRPISHMQLQANSVEVNSLGSQELWSVLCGSILNKNHECDRLITTTHTCCCCVHKDVFSSPFAAKYIFSTISPVQLVKFTSMKSKSHNHDSLVCLLSCYTRYFQRTLAFLLFQVACSEWMGPRMEVEAAAETPSATPWQWCSVWRPCCSRGKAVMCHSGWRRPTQMRWRWSRVTHWCSLCRAPCLRRCCWATMAACWSWKRALTAPPYLTSSSGDRAGDTTEHTPQCWPHHNVLQTHINLLHPLWLSYGSP